MTTDELDLLKKLGDAGMIDVEEARARIEEMARKEILDQHGIRVVLCKDGAYMAHYKDKEGNRRSIRRAKKEDVERAVAEALGSGKPARRKKGPTVQAIFDQVQHDKLTLDHRMESTVLRSERLFKQCFSDLADRSVQTLDARAVERFLVDTKRRLDLTAKAYTNLTGLLRGILREADLQGLIDYDYERSIRRAADTNRTFRSAKKADAEEVYTDEEASTLMAYLWNRATDTGKMHYAGLLLAFYTGLRIGELAVLRWDDVQDGGILVHATETELRHTKAVSDHPKTDAGIRALPIPTEAWKILDIARTHSQGEWVFTYDGVRRIRAEKFRRALGRACEACEIQYRSPHKIRKTYATLMREGGVSDHLLTELMGHTSITVTERVYIKGRSDLDKKRQAVDAVFTPVKPT